MSRLLVVDDDADLRELLAQILEDLGHQVVRAGSVRQAIECLGAPFDLVLTDYQLGDGDGLQLARMADERNPGAPVLMLTGDAARLSQDPRGRAFIARSLEKPVDLEALEQAVTELLQARTTRGGA